ncbi:MAG: Large low complexity coiled coil protein with large repeat region [Candidatus Shapirobacteria bacterium GW2011_GWE1_38_10]|uniref:Large low complexity coiled coil protein with large repeat region n=1 Tax=Candidatus Shapirobacteria bacterium GW2011_GWE1_38_10 TaxID=1618488 RepID=A0A0G0I7K4_9BACT|nr:MAG: Large low complexity coiled coil protein with large repeat region [Candidatus Shapirobacteria bacterium GW2011_GWF2_37_20]KKQ50522.1 MAG: Large low complexity coiled coil protein with large repeat region [Candidatus Shapirobacteria bacterium GW2011_GWE1_38_10]KKQ64663.1 MAG: Large low complexity coiled coil protein with large repeat region [Candidatus Shapirobacteria bacterium GW2011_GWF1_38_23]
MSESPKNIKVLVGALRDLQGRVLLSNERLYIESRQVFEKLQGLKLAKTSDLDVNHIDKTIKVLEALPKEITELDIEELGKESKEPESKALNEKELDQLLDDYKKSESENEKGKIEEKIKKSGNKENVDRFIDTQKEIAKKFKEEAAFESASKTRAKKTIMELVDEFKKAGNDKKREIEKEIYLITGEKDAQKYIQKSEAVVNRNTKGLEKINVDLREKVSQDLIKISENQPEKVVKIVEEASLKEEFDKKRTEREIKKNVKGSEEAERIVQKIEEIRAEIKVEGKAEEIAQITYEKLKTENIPVSERIKVELKEEILSSWKEGDEIKIPDQLQGKGGEIVVREAAKAADIFKENNLEVVVNYRAGELGKEIGTELRRSGVSDEKLIERYVEVSNRLTNNPETIRVEAKRGEIANFVEANNKNVGAGEVERSIDEARFMAKSVVMAPKKFNKAIKDYNEARDLIGAEKLPKLKEIRVVEKMTSLFKNSPGMLRLMNGAQRMTGIFQRINAFPGSLLARTGMQKAGYKILGKIGGQAAVEFVKNAAAVIAKEGTLQGVKTIALSLMGKGAVVAGSGAATGGALAGVVAAFQALPVVGQVVAVVVAAVVLLKGVIDGVKGVLSKITGLDMNGVKNFVSDTLGLGKFVGGTVQFAADVGTLLVGIPTFIGMLAMGAIVTPVVIFFFLGTMAYSMFQQNLVSSLVPPADMSNCVLKSEYGGAINCDQNAPENSITGVDKANFIDIANRWQSGSNFASVCYNDTVNRALCAGINPTYALWVWLHESGASNYSRDDIEDFGIHDSTTPNRNFDAQITKFLTLTGVGSRCLSDPRINGDFWLSWATSYLNGYDCDPDKPNSIFPDMTPRKYAAGLRDQWTWISSSPIPNGILVAKGGKNCGQIGIGSTEYAGNAHEVTDKDGNVWVCTENTQSPIGDFDPNSPGLGGVVVDGECSVGEVVVPTRQCDSQWGQIPLNGGSCANGKPGTICSAGCGPTSVSMLTRHVNGSLTPNNVIFSRGSAYYNMGCEGSSLSQAQTELVKQFGSEAVSLDSVTQGCDEKAIANWICSGKVVMVLANFYRNTSLELGGHFVMAVGVRDGKIVVQDPYYDATDTPFDGTKAYGYAHDIRGCLLVDKTAVK